jgi:hypothetical protein
VRQAIKAIRWLWVGMTTFIGGVSLLMWTMNTGTNPFTKTWPVLVVIVGGILMTVSGWIMYNSWFPPPVNEKSKVEGENLGKAGVKHEAGQTKTPGKT